MVSTIIFVWEYHHPMKSVGLNLKLLRIHGTIHWHGKCWSFSVPGPGWFLLLSLTGPTACGSTKWLTHQEFPSILPYFCAMQFQHGRFVVLGLWTKNRLVDSNHRIPNWWPKLFRLKWSPFFPWGYWFRDPKLTSMDHPNPEKNGRRKQPSHRNEDFPALPFGAHCGFGHEK